MPSRQNFREERGQQVVTQPGTCVHCHASVYLTYKRLTCPWMKGLKADESLSYCEEAGFKDWAHALQAIR